MRVTVGTIAVLGLAVAVAAAQPPRDRAAELKPPQAISANDLPPVARGAIDDFPTTTLPSTPVTRPNPPFVRPAAPSGPAWLTGVDPNVKQASSTGTNSGMVRTLTPPPPVLKDDPAAQPKLLDRIKNAVTGDKPAPQPLPQPVMQQAQQPPQPTASTPFRGTGANGAPVYAGRPAYRWYGWGSVTPGANPLAPTGQYPKASANWYNITGATPGAFPVPVGNPGRVPSGTEPPSYGLAARPQNTPAPVMPVSSLPAPRIQYTERPAAPLVTPAAESKFAPPPGVATPTPPPAFRPPKPAPAPVSVPVITAPPLPKPVVVVPAVPPATIPLPKPEPVVSLPPLPLPVPPVAVAPPVTPVPTPAPVKLPVPVIERKPAGVPGPLPTSVVPNPPREEVQWQQSKEPKPAPGTWAPAPGAAPLPTMPPADAGAPIGRARVAPFVARGQMGDRNPDPIATLIKQVCQGRAEGVEIRYTGTKKLQVCFEVRTAAEAQKLVADISKRPELTAYQIDFCVFVK